MRATLIVSIALALICEVLAYPRTPAFAAPPPAPAANTLDISTVGVPIVSGGRLVNYVLVRLRLTLRPGTDITRLVDKEAFFREALVRLAYRTRLNPSNSLNSVDPALVAADMLPLCQAIAGPNVVTGVQVFHQESQKRLPPPSLKPTPAAAPAPPLDF